MPWRGLRLWASSGACFRGLARFKNRGHAPFIVNSSKEVIQVSHKKSSVSKGLGVSVSLEQPLAWSKSPRSLFGWAVTASKAAKTGRAASGWPFFFCLVRGGALGPRHVSRP